MEWICPRLLRQRILDRTDVGKGEDGDDDEVRRVRARHLSAAVPYDPAPAGLHNGAVRTRAGLLLARRLAKGLPRGVLAARRVGRAMGTPRAPATDGRHGSAGQSQPLGVQVG